MMPDDKKFIFPVIAFAAVIVAGIFGTFLFLIKTDFLQERELKEYLSREVPYYLGEDYVSLQRVDDYYYPILQTVKGSDAIYGHATVYRITLESGKTAYAGWGGINEITSMNVEDFASPELFAKHLIYVVAVNAEKGDQPRFANITADVEGALAIPQEWREWRVPISDSAEPALLPK
ncbi:hypothetical protein HY622_02265 [Candidatus Uhrbacteria bacterium]|nr:hypothetical protein [Candidatus Uhrbacteria bacterium]